MTSCSGELPEVAGSCLSRRTEQSIKHTGAHRAPQRTHDLRRAARGPRAAEAAAGAVCLHSSLMTSCSGKLSDWERQSLVGPLPGRNVLRGFLAARGGHAAAGHHGGPRHWAPSAPRHGGVVANGAPRLPAKAEALGGRGPARRVRRTAISTAAKSRARRRNRFSGAGRKLPVAVWRRWPAECGSMRRTRLGLGRDGRSAGRLGPAAHGQRRCPASNPRRGAGR